MQCNIMKIQIKLILLLTIISYSCLSNSEKSKDNNVNTNGIAINDLDTFIHIIDTIAISRVMELNLEQAILLYGKTIRGYLGKDEEFVLDRKLTEFRIELYNFFSKKQVNNKNIIIKELTWSIDSINNLTVWYEKIDSITYLPKHYLIWDKELEF